MGPPMWPWRCGLMARPVSGVEWSGGRCRTLLAHHYTLQNFLILVSYQCIAVIYFQQFACYLH